MLFGNRFFQVSSDFSATVQSPVRHHQLMTDEQRRVTAFLALNAGVIALALAMFARFGIDLSSLFGSLN